MKLLRKQVLEFIEPLRANKELGSSLEAEAIITTPLDTVLEMKEEMADICIISQIEFKKAILQSSSEKPKAKNACAAGKSCRR